MPDTSLLSQSVPLTADPRIAAAEAWAAEEHQKAQTGNSAMQQMAQEAARAGDSEGYSLIKNFAAGWTESTNNAAAAVFGGIPRMVGDLTGDKRLSQGGRGIEQFFTENAQYGPRPTRAAMGTGEWTDMFNPAAFAYHFGSLTSGVAQMVTPGAALKALNTFRAGVPALVKAARLGDDAIQLAPELADRALRWGRALSNTGATAGEIAGVAAEVGVRPDVFAKAVAASRPLFDDPTALQRTGNLIGASLAGHTQGYGTYKAIKEAGGDEAEALAAYGTMAAVAGKLDNKLLYRWFGEFPPDLKGRIINAAATVGTNSVIPVADLVTQWGATLGGDVPNPAALATIASTMQAVQNGLGPAALLGFLMGSGYSKREKALTDPSNEPAVGEPAHGAMGFAGKPDVLFNIYGSEKSISGKRVSDQGDGTYLVKGINGEPDAIIPHQRVRSVYSKDNAIGAEGSLLFEDNADTNEIAQKYLGDELVREMGINAEKIARKQRAALGKATVRAEANRLQAEDFNNRVQEALAAPEGEQRSKAIESVLETFGASSKGLLGTALQPASNRSMHRKVEIELAKAETELAALQARTNLEAKPEGSIILDQARTRVKLLTAKRDFLDLMHEDMLQALGSAGKAAAELGGKKASREIGNALALDAEHVETVRTGLEEQITRLQSALNETQGLPPGTDLRLQAEQGLREAEAALSLFDRFAGRGQEADAMDLGQPVPEAAVPVDLGQRGEILRSLGYTPEEIAHLASLGRAGDVVAAGLQRPVHYGAGVAATVRDLRAAGVTNEELAQINRMPISVRSAEMAARMLPLENRPAVREGPSPEEIALVTAQQDYAEQVTARTNMQRLLDQVRPEALEQGDPTSETLAQLRGTLEAVDARIASLQKDYPQLKEVPRTVAVGVPGVGILHDDPVVVDRTLPMPETAPLPPVGAITEGRLTAAGAHVERAREIAPALPEPLRKALEEALNKRGTGRFHTPEGGMFRDALNLHTTPTAIARVLGEAMLAFKEHTDLHGNTYKAATVEGIAKALGVTPHGKARFGMESNTGEYRLFQTGSPADRMKESVARFHEEAEIPDLRRNPGIVKKLLRGEMSPLEVAAMLLEKKGRLFVEQGEPDENGVTVLNLQLTHTKPAERAATVHALAQVAYAIQEGLGAALGKTYSPTILTPEHLPLMDSREWDNRFRLAMEPGAWLSDLRDNLRKARQESGAEIRSEEEALFLRMFHGMMEHAATVQGVPAETAARRWLESRAGSGTRPYAKDSFFGIIGAPEGMEQVLEGKRGVRRVKTLNQEGSPQDVLDRVKALLGTTENHRQAAYVWPDGSWVPFGPSSPGLPVKHKAEVIKAGAARVDYRENAIEITQKLTPTQIDSLVRLFSTQDKNSLILIDVIGKDSSIRSVEANPKSLAVKLHEVNALQQEQQGVIKGWFDTFEGPEGPRGLITLTKHADFTTLVEEMSHFLRTTLADTGYAKIKTGVNAFLREKGLPEIRTQDGYDVWSRDAEEVFAKWTLAALREVPSKETPAALRPILEQAKPILESLWDSSLDVYGSPPKEVRAQMVRLFNPLLPRVNATGKMVGVRIKEQASKFGVNQFTATFYTPESIEAAVTFARGTEGTKAVYEAKQTNTEEIFAKVAEWQKNPEEAQRRINAALSVGGTPEPSLIVYQAILAASDAIPAVEALLNAKTDKQRREAQAQLDQLPAALMKKRSSVAAGQALWAHQLDPMTKILNAQNGVLQLTKQMSASDARRLFQDIQDAAVGNTEALARLAKTVTATSVEAPQIGDYIKQLAYAGMMLNPRIHTTNAVMIGVMAGMMKLPLKVTAAMVDAGWSYVAQKPREIFFREIGVNRTALKVGLKRANAGFWDILAHGITNDPLDNARKLTDADKYTQHQLAFEHAPDVIQVPFLGEKAWGSKLRKIAPFVLVGSNLAHAVDFAARSVIYHDTLWQLSLRKALEEGSNDPHLVANRLMKRAMDGTQDTETLRRDARLQSLQATGADEPGRFTANLIAAKNSFGVAAVPFMPYVNTLANLMKRSAELVPGVGYAVWRSQVREQLGKDSPTFYVDRPQEMIGKQIFGGLMGLIVASMFHQRDEDGLPGLTGATPNSAGERDFWRRNGILPYSIRIGGRYVQFSRVDPLGMVLMGAANVADSWSHYQAAQSDPRLEENASAYAATENFFNTMFRDVLNNSYASNFFRMADREGSNSQEVLRSLTSLVPFSGFLRQLASTAWQAHNNGEYVAPDVGPALGAVLGIVPWAWQGIDVQPKRDAFGKPIVYRAQSVFVNWLPVQVSAGQPLDPVEKELRRLGVYPTVPLPSKRLKLVPNGQEFDVPPDLWQQMVTEFGIRGKETLGEIIASPRYESQRDGTMQGVLGQARILDHALDKVRGRYENWLKGEMMKRHQAGLLEKPVPLAERVEVE
jgi:hypothetical protein